MGRCDEVLHDQALDIDQIYNPIGLRAERRFHLFRTFFALL